jgi:hypothetical protein
VNDAAEGAMRGVIGALAMSGFRAFASDLGLIEKTPPEALADEPPEGMLQQLTTERRGVAVRLLHFGVGAAGGVGYGILPDLVRQKGWSGPLWGLAMWTGYDGVVAPALGLAHDRQMDGKERATFIADHLLYGYILSETRRRPSY